MALRARGAALAHVLDAGAIGRRLSTADAAAGGGEFSGKSAYEVLGVSQTSSFAEIKASFRRLAKETHPDVSPSIDEAAASRRFLHILAAYEVLSDSTQRAQYDSYLFSQRRTVQKQPGLAAAMYTYSSSLTITRQREVVEWLEWYRSAIKDILEQKTVASGSGYFYEIENELYASIRAAYYGPVIESMDMLPDCFEAEERSACETSEVLHLVSGRDLLGIVYIVNKVPELEYIRSEKLSASYCMASGFSQCGGHKKGDTSCLRSGGGSIHGMQVEQHIDCASDVYKNLQLCISGRVVATATRSPPKCEHYGTTTESKDHINIFLNLEEDSPSCGSFTSSILLGTITGLGTSAEEESSSVYDKDGRRTHVIMKHRTLMVKHMHWYPVGDEISTCECRCSRARLPPSKFWLFEPRCSLHDIGGWYIETFGRDNKGKTIPSQRQWDSMVDLSEKRLHPAMYLLALGYRTLDLEDAKRRKLTVRNFIEPKLNSILRWCKKLL